MPQATVHPVHEGHRLRVVVCADERGAAACIAEALGARRLAAGASVALGDLDEGSVLVVCAPEGLRPGTDPAAPGAKARPLAPSS